MSSKDVETKYLYKLRAVCYSRIVTCAKCMYAGNTTLMNFVEMKFCGLR